MSQPNYKLKDDHAASIGHVRQLFNISEENYLKKSGGIATSTLSYSQTPQLIDPLDIPNLGLVISEDERRVLKSGDTMTGNLNMGGNKITNIINGVLETDVMTKGYIDDRLLLKKNTGTFDAKI